MSAGRRHLFRFKNFFKKKMKKTLDKRKDMWYNVDSQSEMLSFLFKKKFFEKTKKVLDKLI